MKMPHTFVRILAYLSIEERKYHVAVCCISFLRRVVQKIDRHGIESEKWRIVALCGAQQIIEVLQ